ncbi:MAG: hypothetical protein HQ503_12625 [Rhodospirillales bacterium]|nr:hypothetical protein [Rhodospirillales bacterium]
MANLNIRPTAAYIVPGDEPDWAGDECIDLDLRSEGTSFAFHPGTPAEETFAKLGIQAHPTLPSMHRQLWTRLFKNFQTVGSLIFTYAT